MKHVRYQCWPLYIYIYRPTSTIYVEANVKLLRVFQLNVEKHNFLFLCRPCFVVKSYKETLLILFTVLRDFAAIMHAYYDIRLYMDCTDR